MLLGCIADDFTGATDLANTLTRQGMRTVQTIGIPTMAPDHAEAVVVALKTRTIPAEEAVSQSLAACRWLTRHGAQQIFFKYCSTFDSTDQGNIGPVADALLDELGEGITTICPAFPENGRTIYKGHLFVGDVLLSQSSMRNHPLTPMTDSDLVNVMARQSRYKVGNVPFATVRQGAQAISNALETFRTQGIRHAVIDALDNSDLFELGTSCATLMLVTGGSGAALGLPEIFRRQGVLASQVKTQPLLKIGGPGVVLSGSCSSATLAQVNAFQTSYPSLSLDVAQLMLQPNSEIERCVTWAMQQPVDTPKLIFSTSDADVVADIQKTFGRDKVGAAVEQAIASIAARLAEAGTRRFVIAGGETSGAVTQALGITALDIGPQIAPGVPATISCGTPRYGLVLKSGNFGGPDFFLEALRAIA
jgi:3-dehydrotetronate 4-kinase